MKSEIAGLDYLRFLCAFAVMGCHLLPEISSSYSWGLYGGTPSVYIFFVISGFIIPYSAEGRGAFEFIRSRVVRLVPGVWICSTISFALMYWTVEADEKLTLPSRYFRTFFLIPTDPWHFHTIDAIWLAGPYWTLFVEISFYAVVLALLVSRKFNAIGAFATALGAITLVFWTVWFSFRYLMPSSHVRDLLIDIDYKRYLDLLLITHGAFFGLGVNLWLIAKKNVARRAFSTMICVAGGMLDLLHGAIKAEHPIVVALGIFVIGMAMMLYSITSRRNGVLPARLSRHIGLTTYPLYLIHVPLGHAIILVLILLGMTKAPATVVAMAGSVLCASLIAKYAEPWLQKIFKSWFDRGHAVLGLRNGQGSL